MVKYVRMEQEKREGKIAVSSLPTFVLIAFVAVLVIGAFFLGSLWTKVQILERSVTTAQNIPTTDVKGGESAQQAPVTDAKDVPKVTSKDHVRGDRNARIALVEYSDIECPFCKSFHPTAQKTVLEYKGQVMWVYRHYPLSFHANAQKEAEATECANEIGGNDAFWKYLDTLFERTTSNGTGFSLDKLVPLAQELGLNEMQFKECLDSGKFAGYIKDDMDGGLKAGVSGTPGNILLDTKSGKARLISGAVPSEQMKSAIDEMLK